MARSKILLLALAVGWPAPAGAQSDPKEPPLPEFLEIRLEPPALELEDGRDARRVLVWGVAASGEKFDLSPRAKFTAEGPQVTVGPDRFIEPREKGETRVTVAAAGRTATLPVAVKDAGLHPVGFVRDVMPVLARAGCNAGTCHGAAAGRNGLKLSLRGYDPAWDYEAFVFDVAGRRVNRARPEESLMLLKPTAAVPHEGKQPVKPGSREYELLRRWIAEGTRPPEPGTRATGLEVLPAAVELDVPGRSQDVIVLARYADGSLRDVTREAILTSSDPEVATVQGSAVTAVRRGEASVLVRYEGNYATRLIGVMGDRAGFAWTDPPEHNFIDRHVHAKLRLRKIAPGGLCTDAEFVRRIHLDLTGMPPPAERARAFVSDPEESRTKRERLIDELVGSRESVEHWTNKWADLLQCNSEALGKKGVWAFREWIRKAVAENRPYDAFVRELLLAQGSAYHSPASNYYRVLREPGKITEDVSQTFLGVRFQCNKCHDHPFERWTQNQYYEFGAFFSRVAIKKGTLGTETARNLTGDAITVTGEEIVYRKLDGGEVRHPKTDGVVDPRVPFGGSRDARQADDRREPIVEWLTSKENPLFARSYVNRVWSYFLGRGIIDPPDDIRASNPPSNPALLDALADDFVRSGFDARHLLRTICRSRTYQLSIRADRWNEDDRTNFSHAIARRLTAEQLVDAVAAATGVRARYAGLPEGMRAAEIADGAVAGADFLRLFGRPERKSACECERKSDAFSLSHTLNLINGGLIGEAVASPAGRIARLVEAEKDDARVIEEIYYAVLCRPPTKEELAATAFPAGVPRLEVAQDLAWALMNSPAFFFNR